MVVVVEPVVRAVFLATGKFSDGGHGRTVGLNERSIVSYSVNSKKKLFVRLRSYNCIIHICTNIIRRDDKNFIRAFNFPNHDRLIAHDAIF